MAGKMEKGVCRLCGKYTDLNREHVPPKYAGNRYDVVVGTFEDAINRGLDDKPKGRVQQGGAWFYSFCPEHNRDQGNWYVPAYKEWCTQAMELLMKSDGNPSLYYPYYIYPGRVLKQVVSMFCAINGPELRKAQPELAKYVLDQHAVHLPSKYRFYVYYTMSTRLRYLGLMAMLTWGDKPKQTTVLSELCYPPFGFVLNFNDTPPLDPRLYEITHFSHYQYDDFSEEFLRISTLPVHMAFPGDYRTREEIEKHMLREEFRKRGLELAG